MRVKINNSPECISRYTCRGPPDPHPRPSNQPHHACLAKPCPAEPHPTHDPPGQACQSARNLPPANTRNPHRTNAPPQTHHQDLHSPRDPDRRGTPFPCPRRPAPARPLRDHHPSPPRNQPRPAHAADLRLPGPDPRPDHPATTNRTTRTTARIMTDRTRTPAPTAPDSQPRPRVRVRPDIRAPATDPGPPLHRDLQPFRRPHPRNTHPPRRDPFHRTPLRTRPRPPSPYPLHPPHPARQHPPPTTNTRRNHPPLRNSRPRQIHWRVADHPRTARHRPGLIPQTTRRAPAPPHLGLHYPICRTNQATGDHIARRRPRPLPRWNPLPPR